MSQSLISYVNETFDPWGRTNEDPLLKGVVLFGYTMGESAEILGLNRSQISQYRHGTRSFPLKDQLAVAWFLQLNINVAVLSLKIEAEKKRVSLNARRILRGEIELALRYLYLALEQIQKDHKEDEIRRGVEEACKQILFECHPDYRIRLGTGKPINPPIEYGSQGIQFLYNGHQVEKVLPMLPNRLDGTILEGTFLKEFVKD